MIQGKARAIRHAFTPDSDEALVGRLCEGEAEALDGLMARHPDGRVDYLFSGGLGDERRVFSTEQGEIEVGGALAHLGVGPDGTPLGAVLHGADWLCLGDWQLEAPARAYDGLTGAMVYFVNDAYSRTTAYRLERVEAGDGGSALCFGETSFVLGRGHVVSVVDARTLLSSIPREYACHLGGQGNSLFFDGKRVTNDRGAATHLTAVEFGSPMTLRLEGTEGFAAGDSLRCHDIQRGDRFLLPTTTVFPARAVSP